MWDKKKCTFFVKLQNGPNDDDSKNACLSHWEEKKARIKISHLSFVLDFFPPQLAQGL